MDGAAHDLAVLGEDGLHVGLGDQQGVEVPHEDSGVERARVVLVGHVAAEHQAGGGGGGGPTGGGGGGAVRNSETLLFTKHNSKTNLNFFMQLFSRQ